MYKGIIKRKRSHTNDDRSSWRRKAYKGSSNNKSLNSVRGIVKVLTRQNRNYLKLLGYTLL